MELVIARPEGLYCPPGDFYIDPWRPVDRAVITHGHSDHAHRGHTHYLAAAPGEGILRARLGADISLQPLAYGEVVEHHGVRLSLHPAGHVLGSAQVRIEYGGEVWVASGDYKVEADRTCLPFEPVRCDTFITESTFGLPIYRWAPEDEVFAQVNAWWRGNAATGRPSVLFCYAFGKAQRVLTGLDTSIGAIVAHGALLPLNEVYRAAGVALPPVVYAGDADAAMLKTALVIAPPSAQSSVWMRRFGNYVDGFASGWMRVRGNRRRRGMDKGFVLSDHADWPGLLSAIAATQAQRVIVTHGASDALVRWLREERGLQAQVFQTEYGDDEAEGDTPPAAVPVSSGTGDAANELEASAHPEPGASEAPEEASPDDAGPASAAS